MNRWIDNPYAIAVIIGCGLVFAFWLGHTGGQQYQVASESTRIVQLDEPPVPPSEYDDKITALDREAVEMAYRNQIAHLFEIWMRDDTDQPRRAVNGARKATKAYIEIMKELDARGKAH